MRLRHLLALAAVAVVSVLLATAAFGTGPKHHKRHQPGAFFAFLSGKNEISTTTGRPGAGDLNGRGGATAVIDGGHFCFGITVANLSTPTAAHVHSGPRGVNGPIVIPLTPPTTGDPGASSGCVTIEPALARAIKQHPRRYYFNVHTTDFPNGAVRGQIHEKRF